jgi:hypothetical protein
MDTTMTRSPGSLVSSTESGRKQHDARKTPERGNTKDNTLSPDTAINVPLQAKKKTGSHATSYKDMLTNHTTNKDESDWEVDSDASPYDDPSYSTTETLTSRTQQLSNNMLRSKKGQNKENALTFSSSDSSASDVTGNTNELFKALPKSKSTLTQEDTAPHTLSNNKSPPSKEDPSETSSKGDQTTTATGKEPPLPIGEDTATFMSNTSSPAKEDRMDSYLEGETPTHTPTTNKSPPTREAHTDPPLEDTVMTTTNKKICHAAALSTATIGTALPPRSLLQPLDHQLGNR